MLASIVSGAIMLAVLLVFEARIKDVRISQQARLDAALGRISDLERQVAHLERMLERQPS